MEPDAPTIGLQVLELVGVFAFALSGGLAGVRRRFDLLGVIVLAGAAGLGGGVLRDLLIGVTPPVGVSDWRLIVVVCVAALVTFRFGPKVERRGRLVRRLDAVGLGFFAVAGTLKALEHGQSGLTSVLVGTLTGVGGGVIRDILADQVPDLLAARELYAIPALVGSALFAGLWTAGITEAWVAVLAAAVISSVRLAAMRWGWQAPVPTVSFDS